MNLTFNIDYKTVFGEELVVNVVDTDEQGNPRESHYRMGTSDGEHWACHMTVSSEEKPRELNYYFSVDKMGKQERSEWQTLTHRLELSAAKTVSYNMYCRWADMPEDSYLYSSAFTDCINQQSVEKLRATAFAKTVRLQVRAPQLRQGERLAIVGAGNGLGNWLMERAIRMTRHNYNEWVVDLDADLFEHGKMEFKFVALTSEDADDGMWEDGSNRVINLPWMSEGELVSYDLTQAFFPVSNERLAGTMVPVFSLRSNRSFGVGDFGDLRLMIDFVAATHQRVLQILPINDTTTTHTWTDSYPYSCISIFALHPQYVDLNQLPGIDDKERREWFEHEREEVNALKQIDYERVNRDKLSYLRQLYSQESALAMLKTVDYKRFFHDSEQWLVPYAQYSMLRDKYGTADFSQWKDHNTWNEADRKALSNPRTKAYKEVEFFYFVQYILFVQMRGAHDYARSKGVILKGDIPIGVNRYGCDVWAEPEYFNLNGQAGAPPDAFSTNGQNWGFPTYNWDAMLRDGCRWWVRRFQNMSKFFDAYRIDHILGFFRIWEIPIDAVHGLLGQFSPSLGMTRQEIEAYGLQFREEQFTKPFIADWVIDRVFKQHADEVKEKYLNHTHDDIWEMKPEYDTQRKVEKAFEGKTSSDDIWIRDGLYSLISDVLFIRDRKNADLFHPRISAQFDFAYEALWDNDKAAFNRLYNDYYYRRNNHFWYSEAMKKLPKLVQATRMLVCAEDLGMVPDCVPWVMNELKILSLEIQSMPKDPSVRFGHLSRNPYRSVCTISSHDMPTMRQWWDEDNERAQSYYNTMLHRGGAAPHPLPGWLASDIVSRHLTSPSMLCIISIQDWMAIDDAIRLPDADAERVNIPANPHHYWRYRMHIAIEDLMADKEFCHAVSELVLLSGRK